MVSLCVLCTFRPKPVFTAPPGPIKSPWKSPYNDQSIGKAVNSCNCRNLSSDVLKTSDLVHCTVYLFCRVGRFWYRSTVYETSLKYVSLAFGCMASILLNLFVTLYYRDKYCKTINRFNGFNGGPKFW